MALFKKADPGVTEVTTVVQLYLTMMVLVVIIFSTVIIFLLKQTVVVRQQFKAQILFGDAVMRSVNQSNFIST